ncbi:hypothetical protein EDB89DRAFT_1564214 [Lactarius sanguifluus]|nr:hypothetical protein EDB89DRAFT_1564214 [Lactarius sanguifluus]
MRTMSTIMYRPRSRTTKLGPHPLHDPVRAHPRDTVSPTLPLFWRPVSWIFQHLPDAAAGRTTARWGARARDRRRRALAPFRDGGPPCGAAGARGGAQHIRADVRKTVGDVGTAFVMAGTNATLLVIQASSIHREEVGYETRRITNSRCLVDDGAYFV